MRLRRSRLSAAGSQSLAYLQQDTLANVTGVVGLIGVVWAWYVVWPQIPGMPLAWDWLLAAGILLAGGVVGYLYGSRSQRLASILTVAAMVASVGVALAISREPILAYLLAVAVVTAGVLLDEMGILVAAGACVALMLGLLVGVFGFSMMRMEVALPLFALLLITLFSWLGSRTLHTALAWFEQSYVEAQRNAAETQQRRGELRRTLHALEEATSRIQRTNDELVAARQQAEQERSLKEQFVAHVSHELRTPLNLVVGFAEMLYLSPESYGGVIWTAELVSDIGEMYRAGRHLQNLVNDILDLSRINAHRLPIHREWLNLGEIITDTMDTIVPLLRQKGLAWHLQLADSVVAFVDPVRIRQVLINLLNNAVRFTDEGSISIKLTQSGEALEVAVKDTGMGIPEDQLDSIFESFAQVDGGRHGRGGAGLGLAISQQLVKRHGGRMWATSVPGEGSTFSFSLPLASPEAQLGELRRVSVRGKQLQAPLIVVEQDPEVGDMFRRHLSSHHVILVADPAKAEALIESEHPAAVLLNTIPDRSLEEWMGSIGPLSERYQVPVIRCSVPSAKWLSEATELADCLSKPITIEALNRVIHSHSDGDQLRVLVVDDSTGFANLMMRMLSTIPRVVQVYTAYSGPEALELAAQVELDLILLDIVMPGMSGFEVLDRLKADPDLEHIAVVALTSTSYSEELVTHNMGRWTLTQNRSLPTDTYLDLLDTALQLVKPNYLGDVSTLATV